MCVESLEVWLGLGRLQTIRSVLLYRCFLHLASSVFLLMLYPVTMSHSTDCHKTNPFERGYNTKISEKVVINWVYVVFSQYCWK